MLWYLVAGMFEEFSKTVQDGRFKLLVQFMLTDLDIITLQKYPWLGMTALTVEEE